MKKDLLSICCLSYNHGDYIEDCIKSIWAQDYKNIEIIALDDGSTDNSADILNKLKKISPCPMNVYVQENSGNIAGNMNKLINAANGEYIVMLACDDALVPDTLGAKVNILKNNDNIAFVCNSKINIISDNKKIRKRLSKLKLYKIKNPSAADLLELDFNDFHSYYAQGSVYRKSIIDELNAFDEDMICDDLIFRTKYSRYLSEHPNLDFVVLPVPGIFYRRHSSNVSNNSYRQLKGVIEYLNRYWNKRTPPIILLKWIGYTTRNTHIDKIKEIFLESPYGMYIYEKLKLNKKFNEYGYCYNEIGIPYIFTLRKYRNLSQKTLIIKFFNKQIIKSVNTV